MNNVHHQRDDNRKAKDILLQAIHALVGITLFVLALGIWAYLWLAPSL